MITGMNYLDAAINCGDDGGCILIETLGRHYWPTELTQSVLLS